MTDIVTIPEFDRDVKKLRKKYKSLDSDLELFCKALRVIRITSIRDTVRVSDIGDKYKQFRIFKVRSFHCKDLKGKGSRSGIRIIYHDDADNDIITLIEIYHKSTDENHDKNRIILYLDKLMSKAHE